MGSRITILHPPRRIVSLVPSQTELLSSLTLTEAVVGITRYCVHPSHWRSTKTIVGGTKKFDTEVIEKLQPDLIIGNKEENYPDGIERLKKNFPVWMSDVITLHDALSMIESVGLITDRLQQSNECINQINKKLNGLRKYDGQSVLYLIWKDPWMAAGRNTFIHSVLNTIGFRNVLDSKDRYPQLTIDEIQQLNPDYIFLSSEPYPFRESHLDQIKRLKLQSKTLLVDGQMFSWYGSRLISAFDYFNTLALD
jgi:ABC-type Fe3+-hydroxamate transport system substrate-binding protein